MRDEPAFPNDGGLGNTGMSLRTYLAGQALAGLCANVMVTTTLAKEFNLTRPQAATTLSHMACEVADALLAELGKEKT